MEYIKRLIILSGEGRGTLILEKSALGISGRLSVFGLKKGSSELLIIGDGEIFCRPIIGGEEVVERFDVKDELGLKTVHAAIVKEGRVIIYGTNQAKIMSEESILNKYARAKKYDKTTIKEDNRKKTLTFSGRQPKVDQMFLDIVPETYDDFAIADKNYYPAYIKLEDEVMGEGAADCRTVHEKNSNESAKTAFAEAAVSAEEKTEMQSCKTSESKPAKNEEACMKEKKEMLPKTDSESELPCRLEAKYLKGRLAAFVCDKDCAPEKVRSPKNENERKDIVELAARMSLPKSENIKKKISDEGHTKINDEGHTKSFIGAKTDLHANSNNTAKKESFKRKAAFYEKKGGKIEKVLSSFPVYDKIQKLIPDSRFVRIDYDGKRFYLVGKVGNLVCYGVPARYTASSPEEFCGYCSWLPEDPSLPTGDGYWLLYQNAVTGEPIRME